jgi:hypothetical protein
LAAANALPEVVDPTAPVPVDQPLTPIAAEPVQVEPLLLLLQLPLLVKSHVVAAQVEEPTVTKAIATAKNTFFFIIFSVPYR